MCFLKGNITLSDGLFEKKYSNSEMRTITNHSKDAKGVEGSFPKGAEKHGMRYTRLNGLAKVKAYAVLLISFSVYKPESSPPPFRLISS